MWTLFAGDCNEILNNYIDGNISPDQCMYTCTNFETNVRRVSLESNTEECNSFVMGISLVYSMTAKKLVWQVSGSEYRPNRTVNRAAV